MKQFQSDESISYYLPVPEWAQGIDLFAASTTIYYEPTLSSTTLEQSRTEFIGFLKLDLVVICILSPEVGGGRYL